MKKIEEAKGKKGCLLDSFNGNYHFRLYNDDGTFKDYLLRHCDLSITIDDEEACFYEDENGNLYLSHQPETLGIKSN